MGNLGLVQRVSQHQIFFSFHIQILYKWVFESLDKVFFFSNLIQIIYGGDLKCDSKMHLSLDTLAAKNQISNCLLHNP